MIQKANNNLVNNIVKDSLSKYPAPSGTVNNQADASLQVTYGSLNEIAKQPPQENPDAVQRARQLLLSGQLDSPENIRAAAESIATMGI